MLNLNKGEHKELVYINSSQVDIHVQQHADSVLRVVVINLPQAPDGEINHTIHIDHVEAGCHTEIYALAFIKDKEQVRIHTRMHHDVGEGESKQVVKFVLADQAQGAFLGELKIQPNAQQVSAEQTNRNLLLSDEAIMRTQPQLEIYADDVKASHGASSGQLDESALFYMQQRGIDAATGRRMLVAAFMKDIVEQVSDAEQREQLLQTIDSVV
ncbi:MAG: SufD family Fe-S cluster assembly protein [Paludibacteraceae bacterium]|nr:SufD family Fe-S cluster assembly protein [Paludibacteraceae bacterium]